MLYFASWDVNDLNNKRSWTVEQVARQVGYESVYAFSKTFKRLVGLAPADFRKQQLLVSQLRD